MLAISNRLQKQIIDTTASNSVTLVDSAVTVYPIHAHYEEKWWQHTPLSESNTHAERLLRKKFFSIFKIYLWKNTFFTKHFRKKIVYNDLKKQTFAWRKRAIHTRVLERKPPRTQYEQWQQMVVRRL